MFANTEAVVAESVVVIKKLLQLQPKENKDLIVQVAKMAGHVEVYVRANLYAIHNNEYCISTY